MTLRRLSALAAIALLASPALAQGDPEPQRTVAVTFDDLPFQASEEDICNPAEIMAMTETFVAMLEPLDTHAVAFVNEGHMCESERIGLLPVVFDVWQDAGIELGNHTFSHINIHQTTAGAYLADVDRGEILTRTAMESVGERLRYFRHPFLFTGETQEKHDAIAAGLAARNYTVAPVTLDNNDWMFAGAYRAAEAAGDEALKLRIGQAYVEHMITVLNHFEPYSAGLTGGREPAQILLLHANQLNSDWYPKIHAVFLSRGYRFVTLEEALADPIYQHDDTYVQANGISWLHRWMATEGRPIQWEPEPPQWIRDAYAAAEASAD